MSEAIPAEVQTATIVVNGQEKSVPSRDVTWAEVVDLAYPGQWSDPDLSFIVTSARPSSRSIRVCSPRAGRCT